MQPGILDWVLEQRKDIGRKTDEIWIISVVQFIGTNVYFWVLITVPWLYELLALGKPGEGNSVLPLQPFYKSISIPKFKAYLKNMYTHVHTQLMDLYFAVRKGMGSGDRLPESKI